MSKKVKAIKVGTFITVIILIFVIGQLWMLRFNVGREGYNLNIFFNDVSGLKIADPVRVYGIKKGKVINMEMIKGGVLVNTWIEKSIVLREDAKASIQDVAMISGTKTIVIDPGISKEYFDISETLLGEPSLGLSTVEIGSVAMAFEDMLAVLKKGIGGGEGALKKLELTLNELYYLLKENRDGLKKVVNQGGKNLDKSEQLLDEMYTLVGDLRGTVEKVNKKEGTLGKLVYDEDLYNNLNKASASLDSLLVDLRKNPGRYVHISIF